LLFGHNRWLEVRERRPTTFRGMKVSLEVTTEKGGETWHDRLKGFLASEVTIQQVPEGAGLRSVH
jgi:hypothetical protein